VLGFDTLLLVLAALNAGNMVWAGSDSGGCFACPWYVVSLTTFSVHGSAWTFSPTRVLVAAACLRGRRSWTDVVAALISAQLVAGTLLYLAAPDYWTMERAVVSSIVYAPQFQGILAAIVLAIAAGRVVARVAGRRARRGLVIAAGAIVVCGLSGFASNLVSHARAEQHVARFVSRNLMGGRPFKAGAGFRDESLRRFQEIGAPVTWTGDSRDIPYADVGPTAFVFPFVLNVEYTFQRGRKEDGGVWSALVFDFFGWTAILDPSSGVWRRLLPYFWPV
jgi:hypothetical protein